MVHHATDSVPCLRERTDFCYCCGMEVLPDYPHEELNSPGVNHFPDGVFNDCRVVADGYDTMIQARSRKRRGSRGTRRARPSNAVFPAVEDEQLAPYFNR